jgi:ribosome hibernation promoting factor
VKVVIHDRTERLPASLRSDAERKLSRLTRHFDRVLEAEVHFEEESRRSRERAVVSRILVHAVGRKAPLLKAQESASDEKAALDLALDKIDRQVRKLKEKRRDRRAASPAEVAVSMNGDAPREIAAELDIVHRHLKPESLDQARRKLETEESQFHLFVNEDSGEVNVIYRRADGGLRVIEPVLK